LAAGENGRSLKRSFMGKVISSIAGVFYITVMVALAAADAPLTPELVKEIQKDPYVDESVQTTNGNAVGILTEVVSDKSGKPVLGVIQPYENVTIRKEFLAVPWSLLRFDKENRRIQIQAAAGPLRNAPTFQQNQIAGLAEGPELQKIYQHFGTAVGGGSVAATMGSQTGQGSSTIPRPPTDAAQPTRGSVSVMYILGVLAIVALGLGYFVRRRT
jgi:hypothetical protein